MPSPSTSLRRRRAAAPDRSADPVRVAAIDRDSGFLTVLARRLREAEWPLRVLASPVPMEELRAMRLGAVVIDLEVLGSFAWAYLERVCNDLPALAVIVCTGPSSVAQRVRGLRLGADDWITKPTHPEEVVARIEATVRRHQRANPDRERQPVEAGELTLHADRFQAFAAGRDLELTRREFEVLWLLAQASGHVLPREEIYERAWGYAMAHGDRSVDVFVRKLRQKLERASPRYRYLHTHFAIGYRFGVEPTGPSAGEDE